ncbi:L-aspartate oxidase [Neisseriaceae bacterium ESL0693]|nr:L-aspartate oxidase [Neisseriaceae bacterium ESL0693]
MQRALLPESQTDVLIVGAGLAGLSVALSLPAETHITLIAQSDLIECASGYAQGGIAAVLDPFDQVKEHVHDTLIAGAGLCDTDHVRHILSQAGDAIQWLCQLGVPFSRENGTLHLTREGGHSQRRIAHVADHTGLSITTTLQQHLKHRPNIRLLPQTQLQQLITDTQGCNGGLVRQADGSTGIIHARCTVLATGGLGQLFGLTTNPLSAQGHGVALAALAGCRVKQLAFVQFHPTALAKPQNPCFLISEAVRGEGGLLRNHRGERFMEKYDQRLELAPRDIVARAIATEMAENRQSHVFLDITHLDTDFIIRHFPSIYQHCLTHQIDITRDWIPVAPAAHYACGGVITDLAARTDVPALYVVGETACTGLHGANRLASNSLLECVVLGRAAAQNIQHYLADQTNTWPAMKTDVSAISWNTVKTALAQTKTDNSIKPIAFNLTVLQHHMSQYFGICRSDAGMRKLWQQLHYWYQQSEPSSTDTQSLITTILMVYDGLHQNRNHGAHYNIDLLCLNHASPSAE